MYILSEDSIRQIQPSARELLLHDGAGLYLRVRKTSFLWLYRFTENGARKRISLGTYPQVSLEKARALAQDCAKSRDQGVDAQRSMQLERLQSRLQDSQSLESVARRWHGMAAVDRRWSTSYATKVIRHLEIHIFPWLGKLDIGTIHPTELVRCLHRIKDRGTLETAQRVREVVQQVFSFAVDIGVLEPTKNFVTARIGALPSPRSKHYAAILEPAELGKLLNNIDSYNGNFIVKCALQLAPMLFQRPGQLRQADWKEIDLEQAVWTCPARKMKLREWQKHDKRSPPHLVPLPSQAVQILKALHELSGPHGAVFKSVAKRSEATRYISDNTLNAALRTMGYDTQNEVTTHGFRATARTLIRQQLRWPEDVIERHLAHVSSEELGSAYDRATLFEERRLMVQQWADYLTQLKTNGPPSLQALSGRPKPTKLRPVPAVQPPSLPQRRDWEMNRADWRD